MTFLGRQQAPIVSVVKMQQNMSSLLLFVHGLLYFSIYDTEVQELLKLYIYFFISKYNQFVINCSNENHMLIMNFKEH